MKNQTFLKIMAVFFISFFFINETNAQCKPNAGEDLTFCSILSMQLEGVLSDTSSTALWTQIAGTGAVSFADSTNPTTIISVSENGLYQLVLKETLGACVDYDTVVLSFVHPDISACPDCYRLENTLLPDGHYVGSVAVDTVCLNDLYDYYLLKPKIDTTVYYLVDTSFNYTNINYFWSCPSSSIHIVSNNIEQDTLMTVSYNYASYNGDYFTLLFKAEDFNG